MSELVEKLNSKCMARGLSFEPQVLEDELEDAISTVNNRRDFVPTSTSLYEKQYENLIMKMALYSLTKMGAEGETSHSENGISRTYSGGGDYPNELLNQIIPK